MNNKIWSMLSINGEKVDREIAVAFLDDIYSGIYETDTQSHIYFENPNKKNIEEIIFNYSNINDLCWSEVKNKDWNEKWRPFFKNLNIDDRVMVVPSWETDIDCDDKIVLKIEPGMAFGTGHHETTSMMISAILKYFKDDFSVLDVGAGSGILSILAQKLGSAKVDALDNDPDIENNFEDNMRLNHSSINLKIEDCLGWNDFDYDLILANINYPILEKFVQNISNKNNLLILSGILISDIINLKEIINDRKFEVIDTIKQNEWACLIVKT